MKTHRWLKLFRAQQTAVTGWMGMDPAHAAGLVGSSGPYAVVIDCRHGMAGHARMLANAVRRNQPPPKRAERTAQ